MSAEIHHQYHYSLNPSKGPQAAPPNEAAAAQIGNVAQELSRQHHELHEVIHTAPNLNEKYKDEIALVEQQFLKDGLSIDPITVLSAGDFQKAIRAIWPRIFLDH